MSQHKDIEEMIEIIELAIVREESERDFFRRSAEASTSKVAKALLLEIEEEFGKHIAALEARKERLQGALADLTGGKDKRHLPSGPPTVQSEREGWRDPVCGMRIENDITAGTSIYQGRTYRFCSLDCKKAFDVNPDKYIGKE